MAVRSVGRSPAAVWLGGGRFCGAASPWSWPDALGIHNQPAEGEQKIIWSPWVSGFWWPNLRGRLRNERPREVKVGEGDDSGGGDGCRVLRGKRRARGSWSPAVFGGEKKNRVRLFFVVRVGCV